MKFSILTIACCITMVASVDSVTAQQRPGGRNREGVAVGKTAPDFELTPLGKKEPVKLKDLQGKPVLLIFGSCT